MKKIKEFKIKSHSKISGKLIPLSFNKKFPIRVKRVFFLYGKKNKIRGKHAHKKCSQLFIPIFGKFVLDIRTPDTKKKIILNHLSKFSSMYNGKVSPHLVVRTPVGGYRGYGPTHSQSLEKFLMKLNDNKNINNNHTN